MRILVISYFFPPFNTMGAVRVGKTAKYLTKLGHDVRIITAKDQPLQPTLPLEIPSENVVYTRWLNLNKPAEIALGGRGKVAARGYEPKGILRGVLKKLGSLYKSLFNLPDGQVGWYPFALRAASRLIEKWRPDLIYASAKPFTSLLVARALSRRHRIPWVGELRDLWVDGHYYNYPSWRRKVEERLERRVLSSATGLVTVSEPWAETLRAKYSKSTAVVLNGFDPNNYPPHSEIPFRDGQTRIVYTGMIYEGQRDPTPLFHALRQLGGEAGKVRVAFYGRYLEGVRQLASRMNIENLVEVNDPVPYEEALKIQSQADILLLLLWNDSRERGVYTGKLFEYIGARRPILAIGPTDNVAAELITERKAGVTLDDPDRIANQLHHWVQQKEKSGAIPGLPKNVGVGLSREVQTKKLDSFLREVVAKAR